MYYALSTTEADIHINASPGDFDGVRVDMDDNTPAGTAFISGECTPAQARELAAALLRAADEADGREPVGALKHIMAVLDMQYDADEIAEDPRILTQIRADAERMVGMVREEVARDLEAMDGTNLGMSLTRTHAVNVARRGLAPQDTQHGRTLNP
ncbi:hypothetical protein ABZ446_28695 [Streptomyces sp. NPDC005813]|uniref:hypothetical protein n=1 Tax=Streptomyces sp. NPDC005813 TaxID=3155592 RepID=UPI0033ECDAB8